MSHACAPNITRGTTFSAKSATSFPRLSKRMSVSTGGRKYFLGEVMVVS